MKSKHDQHDKKYFKTSLISIQDHMLTHLLKSWSDLDLGQSTKLSVATDLLRCYILDNVLLHCLNSHPTRSNFNLERLCKS